MIRTIFAVGWLAATVFMVFTSPLTGIGMGLLFILFMARIF